MSRGKRYDAGNNKINIKKVIAVAITLIVVVLFIVFVTKLIQNNINKKEEKAVALAYYTVFENNKWGVISSQGNVVIAPTYDEMIEIPNNDKDVFIITYDINYSNGTYTTKAINSKNEQLFSSYESVETIQNQDEQNSVWYSSNCLKVKKGGKYGIIDLTGKQLVDCIYDSITPLLNIKNSLVTVKDGKKGLISTTGTVIINNEYENIEALTNEYEDGYIVKNSEGKYGVVGANKKIIIPTEYELIKNVKSNDNYVVKKDEKLQIYNATSNATTSLGENITDVKSINDVNVLVKKSDKYGIVGTDGIEKLEAKYEELEYAFSNFYIAKLEGKYGIIGLNGETKIEFLYSKLVYRKDADFVEGEKDGSYIADLIDRDLQIKLTGIVSEINITKGYIKVRINNEYKYYNLKFEEKENTEILSNNTIFLSKKEGKYGFVDKNGVVIVNYIYDDATEQNDFGYVAVKKDGKWGALDQTGKIIVDTILNLDKNSLISFIGTWHLAEDINAGYYVK